MSDLPAKVTFDLVQSSARRLNRTKLPVDLPNLATILILK